MEERHKGCPKTASLSGGRGQDLHLGVVFVGLVGMTMRQPPLSVELRPTITLSSSQITGLLGVACQRRGAHLALFGGNFLEGAPDPHGLFSGASQNEASPLIRCSFGCAGRRFSNQLPWTNLPQAFWSAVTFLFSEVAAPDSGAVLRSMHQTTQPPIYMFCRSPGGAELLALTIGRRSPLESGADRPHNCIKNTQRGE